MKSLGMLLFSATLLSAAPAPPSDTVFKPTFLTFDDSLTAGTGFVVHLEGTAFFLTAFHLFGPAAGLQRDLTPIEAKDYVNSLAASGMEHPALVITSPEMLLIPTAKASRKEDVAHDIAAFRLKDYKGPSLTIAKSTPKVGDTIYLFARPRGEEKLRLIPAKATLVEPSAIEYIFDETGFNIAGTSGAPILNESKEVIGINVLAGQESGKIYALANPATSFVPLLVAALRSNP